MNLKDILRHFKPELKAYEITLKEILKSEVVLIDRVSQYLIKHKGKNLRPLLVILAAKIAGKHRQCPERDDQVDRSICQDWYPP